MLTRLQDLLGSGHPTSTNVISKTSLEINSLEFLHTD